MRLKVSNVCQLYAKNIWREYTDLYGVSIKNNNDGSITLNGTATETFFYTNILDYEIKPNHVYFYFDAYNEEPSWSTYVGGCEGKIIDASGASGANYAIYNLKREGTIAKARPDLPKNLLNTFCMCYKGFTLNNVTIKPQLFDLTEMYGAGNEPTTVAQFRQDFPNEMYEYSPVCWKKFRRLKYVTDKYGSIDLGTLHWEYGGIPGQFYTHPPLTVTKGNGKIFCNKYQNKENGWETNNNIFIGLGGAFGIRDDSFTSTDSGVFKQSLSGVIASFELKPDVTYENPGYLPLNRGKYIANKEPVQLLDKSNYEVTSTKFGITWTNNGDGTITANGNVVSSTLYSPYRISLSQFREVKNNHKYALFSGINHINVAYVECIFWLGNSVSYFSKNCVETNIAGTFGFTIPQGEYLLYQKVELRVRVNYTANNLVFKPQLFDLTEMYGAGNEPKTVEQFRADFPNELYDYNPYNAITFR